jgi:hypothetical protein
MLASTGSRAYGKLLASPAGAKLELLPDLLAALDAYRATFSPEINRAAALRKIAADYLGRRGLLKK